MARRSPIRSTGPNHRWLRMTPPYSRLLPYGPVNHLLAIPPIRYTWNLEKLRTRFSDRLPAYHRLRTVPSHTTNQAAYWRYSAPPTNLTVLTPDSVPPYSPPLHAICTKVVPIHEKVRQPTVGRDARSGSLHATETSPPTLTHANYSLIRTRTHPPT